MTEVLISILIIISPLAVIYWYLTKNFNYWKSRGIAQQRPYPIVGSYGAYYFGTYQEEDVKRYKKYGRIHGGYEGSRPFLFLANPELLKDILVTDFASFPQKRDTSSGNQLTDSFLGTMKHDSWKRVYGKINAFFSAGNIRNLHKKIMTNCNTLCENFMTEARRGCPVDCQRFFGAYAIDEIFSIVFTSRVDSLNDTFLRLIENENDILRWRWKYFAHVVFHSFMKRLHIPLTDKKATNYLHTSIHLMKEHRQVEKRRDDYLQMLLDAAKEASNLDGMDKDGTIQESNGHALTSNMKTSGLTAAEVDGQCLEFMTTGYYSTRTALSSVAYCLARNPEHQEKLIQEIDDLHKNNRTIDFDTIRDMKYLEAVVAETLRLYPPFSRLERSAAHDYRLKDTGIEIPKGMTIVIPIYAMHHDPEFYNCPEQFCPERFLPENKRNIIPFTYLPFGAGPRECIAKTLALMQTKICLVEVLRVFRFKKCPETQDPVIFNPGNMMIIPKSIILKLEVRKDVRYSSD